MGDVLNRMQLLQEELNEEQEEPDEELYKCCNTKERQEQIDFCSCFSNGENLPDDIPDEWAYDYFRLMED